MCVFCCDQAIQISSLLYSFSDTTHLYANALVFIKLVRSVVNMSCKPTYKPLQADKHTIWMSIRVI